MSTPGGPSRKSTSGETFKRAKHADGLGITRKSLEQIKKYVDPLGPQDLKYINYKPEAGLQKVTENYPIRICGREPVYASRFEELEAFRKKLGLKPSVPLDVEVKSDVPENKILEDNEYIRASLAERLRVFDGLEDHSPPFVTEGNVAVPIFDGGELRSELEYH